MSEIDDIYIGTVVSENRTFSRYGVGDVWTLYTVSVEKALLGDLSGNITVIQLGGFDPVENVLVVAGGDPLLEEGTTYLFASQRNQDRGFRYTVSHNGRRARMSPRA